MAYQTHKIEKTQLRFSQEKRWYSQLKDSSAKEVINTYDILDVLLQFPPQPIEVSEQKQNLHKDKFSLLMEGKKGNGMHQHI